VMFGAVYAMNGLRLPALALLLLQILVGIALYAGLALLLRLESLRYLQDTLLALLRKHRKG
ncbi:MAG: hypothetical protein RSC98_02530, partial [Clostridia bacterium]